MNILWFPPRERAQGGCGERPAGRCDPAPWRLSSACVPCHCWGPSAAPRDSRPGQGHLSQVWDSQMERSPSQTLPSLSRKPPSPTRPFSFHQCQASWARFLLWLKPISRSEFAAELHKGLVLTWFGFSKFNYLPCFVSLETETPLYLPGK